MWPIHRTEWAITTYRTDLSERVTQGHVASSLVIAANLRLTKDLLPASHRTHPSRLVTASHTYKHLRFGAKDKQSPASTNIRPSQALLGGLVDYSSSACDQTRIGCHHTNRRSSHRRFFQHHLICRSSTRVGTDRLEEAQLGPWTNSPRYRDHRPDPCFSAHPRRRLHTIVTSRSETRSRSSHAHTHIRDKQLPTPIPFGLTVKNLGRYLCPPCRTSH